MFNFIQSLRRHSTFACVLLLVTWCVLLFGYGLTAGELWRTEGLRALVAREMMKSGNWLVPTLYGQPVFTKPPGMYLAIILCSYPLGDVSDWSARLPSVLAGFAVVFMFFGYFRRFLGNGGGLVAALIVPMSPMWLDKAPAAEIDMLQVAWVAAALLCFFRALEAHEEGTSSAAWWYGAMLATAGGFLTKWTAPAFFYATALSLLWWRGRLRLLLCRHHVIGACIAASLALGWVALAASSAGWDVFWSEVKREGLSRLVPNYEGDRPYRFGEALFHPLKLLATTLPWSVLALYTLVPGCYRSLDVREKFLCQAMHAWVWPSVLVWSYMTEHTPRHSFPLFPGIAGLATIAWVVWQRGQLRWTVPILRPSVVLGCLLAVWIIVKVAFVEAIVKGATVQVAGKRYPLGRSVERRAREKAEKLANLIPAGHALYVKKLKDEGIMYYLGRPVRRLHTLADFPTSDEVVYCILVPAEWEQWDPSRPAELVHHLVDEQGDPQMMSLRQTGTVAERSGLGVAGPVVVQQLQDPLFDLA